MPMMKTYLLSLIVMIILLIGWRGDITVAQTTTNCPTWQEFCPESNGCVGLWLCASKEKNKTKNPSCIDKCNGSESCICKCNGGIVLNTSIPFLWRCISKTSDGSTLLWISNAITQIFMTLIITWGFAMVIRWGVQIAMGQTKEGKQKIINVVIAFAVLGSLGIILRMINPNFFK